MLFNGDCLEVMKTLDDKSIDLVFCDLPYGQTSCKWDCKIDLEEFWKQIMRIKKLNTPIFFTTTTKFGVELIQSAPKKCFFRYDLVWVKSAPAGFLCAKKMPMRKHEMIYVFYEKLPFYDLSRHTHKFIKKETTSDKIQSKNYETDDRKNPLKQMGSQTGNKGYDPPLPVSVIKKVERKSTYGEIETHDLKTGKNNGVPRYDPPLPTSVVKEENSNKNSELYGKIKDNGYYKQRKSGEGTAYDPPLPVSVVSGASLAVKQGNITITELEPEPEPQSCSPEGEDDYKEGIVYKIPFKKSENADKQYQKLGRKNNESAYDPPLPNTLLEINSTRGKHSTEKPVALMEWILSYYSKEGDIILDPTMGSGSTGVACKNLNRNFIGIELDPEIFEVAKSRNPNELVKG